MPAEMTGRGGTLRIGDGPSIPIVSWRLDTPDPSSDVIESHGLDLDSLIDNPPQRTNPVPPTHSYSGRTRLLYRDEESGRTYEVERANIRTTSNTFPDRVDDFGFAQYHPFNYSIRGDLRIALPADPQIYVDLRPGRRGLFVAIEPSGLRFTVPVLIQEVQSLFFARVDFSFVASSPLTQTGVDWASGDSISSPLQSMPEHPLESLPANPEVVWRHAERLAQRNAPVEPPTPPRPARRRRLLVPVNVPIEA